MNYGMKPEDNTATLLEWIEPQVRQLDVRETAQGTGVGGDGSMNGGPNGDDTLS